MNKKEMRQSMLNNLKEIKNQNDKDIKIYRSLFENDKFMNAKSVGITMSMNNEIDTKFIIKYLMMNNVKVYIPKCDYKSKIMTFDFLDSLDNIKIDSYGIEVVDDVKESDGNPELILVPGVIFSTSGYRIGYGGGFYDRYLSDYKGDTISLCYEMQIGEVPVENHDIPVQTIITEERIINGETL